MSDKNLKYLLSVFFVLIVSSSLFAQKKNTNLYRNNSDDIIVLDTNNVFIEDKVDIKVSTTDKIDTLISKLEFDKDKKKTVVEDDHDHDHDHFDTDLDSSFVAYFDSLGYDSLAIALIADSSYWMTIDTFFRFFNSYVVDPYKYDASKYNDTIKFVLSGKDKHGVERGHSMPLKNLYTTSKFGQRHYKWHYGTDLRLNIGDSVLAAFDGVVRISKFNYKGYGHYVVLRHHNGLETLYGHLKEKGIKVGQHVKAGEFIGYGGNTGRSSGPHLHFEVRYRGVAIDPEYVYDFAKGELRDSVFTLTPEHFKYVREMRMAVYHKIRSGDTLSGIAKKYRVSVAQICRLNGISTRTVLRIGRVLRVR